MRLLLLCESETGRGPSALVWASEKAKVTLNKWLAAAGTGTDYTTVDFRNAFK
jgi:hypothetical protein